MSDEKTEQATPKRLRDIREKGQVAKSQDVPSALTVMAVAVYFLAMASSMLNTLLTMGEIPMRIMNLPFEEALPMAVTATFHCALLVAGPLIGMVMVVALCANLLQVGVLVSLQAAMPKLDNIHPDKWFKKIFSLKNLVEFIKNVIKVSVLSLTVYIIFTDYLPRLFRIPMGDIGDMWVLLGAATGDLVLTAAAVFCVIAALDWFFQKWQFGKQNMMSKDEVKREYKESEGDPLIKGKRLVLIDDSLVRGTQLRGTAQFLYGTGAKELHIRLACPPLLYGCPYLNFSRSTSEMELIARRKIAELEGEMTAERLAAYTDPDSAEYAAMIEKIRADLRFTSLRYPRRADMPYAPGLPACKCCTYCWNGKK